MIRITKHEWHDPKTLEELDALLVQATKADMLATIKRIGFDKLEDFWFDWYMELHQEEPEEWSKEEWPNEVYDVSLSVLKRFIRKQWGEDHGLDVS